MVFKATSTKPQRTNRRSGFTLAETIIGLGLGVLLAATFMTFVLYNSRSFSILANHLELHQGNRQALDTMTRDIRQVRRMTIYATNSVTFEDSDGIALKFEYNPAKRTLTKTKGTSSQVLLKGCDSIKFEMMQRNIIEGTYDYYPADEVETCKVVRVRWICSRDLLGKKSQISEEQSTDVVIRKQ